MSEGLSPSLLVAYASKTGTTREIAERIASIANDAGHATTLHDVATETLPGPLSSWDRIILGAPVNGMQPAQTMNTFVATHPDLTGRVIGVYLVSMVYPTGRKIWQRAIAKSARKLAEQVGCDTWTVFGGRAGSELPAIARIIFGTPRNLPEDQRDWPAIQSWADHITRLR
jgi:menaquinone-dependent protoporphyrinogen oxidase